MRAQDVYNSEEEKNEENTSEESDKDVYAHEGQLLWLGESSPINIFHNSSQREITFFTLDIKFLKMYVLSSLTTGHVVIVAMIGWLIN